MIVPRCELPSRDQACIAFCPYAIEDFGKAFSLWCQDLSLEQSYIVMVAEVTYREGCSKDDATVVHYFHGMWVGMSFPEEELAPDFEEQTLQFIAEARQFRQYKAFIAEADGKPAGSVSCQLFGGLYPLVFAESARWHTHLVVSLCRVICCDGRAHTNVPFATGS